MSDPTKNRKHITVPKVLNATSVALLLNQVSIVFSSEEKKLEMYALDLSKIKKTNVLGMLLIYKIIEYSVEKNCFKEPYIYFENYYIENKLAEYDFIPLINSYIQLKDSSSKLKNLKIQLTDKFILAPQPLLRDSNFTNNYLKTKFLPKISEYYNGQDKVISMIFTCFSEILLNFWEHAVEDTKSIMIADGNKQYIEIACADTGNGIISTLQSNPKYKGFSKEQLIFECVNKNVTSKENTFHMGYGLWLIDQIVSEIKGRFHLFSEGIAYSNEYGKKKVFKTAYWKGTIVYLAMPIQNAKSLVDIESFKNEEMNNIKIDFI